MTSGTVPFKEDTVPCLQPQGGFLREQEGLCALQKQPSENTDVHVLSMKVTDRNCHALRGTCS